MIAEFTNWLIELIKTHGVLAVILGVAIETVIVPIPSPLILMAAGFILLAGKSIGEVIVYGIFLSVVSGITQTIGSYIVYGIAYYGGKPLINRWHRWIGVSWEEITKFNKKFQKKKREELTIFILRALPIMPLSVISGVAGAIRMDFKKYTISTFLGVLPRNMILLLIGWQMEESYKSFAGYINNAENYLTIFLVVLIIAYFVAKKTGFIDKIREKLLR